MWISNWQFIKKLPNLTHNCKNSILKPGPEGSQIGQHFHEENDVGLTSFGITLLFTSHVRLVLVQNSRLRLSRHRQKQSWSFVLAPQGQNVVVHQATNLLAQLGVPLVGTEISFYLIFVVVQRATRKAAQSTKKDTLDISWKDGQFSFTGFDIDTRLPLQHQEALIGDPIDFGQMFQCRGFLALGLLNTAVQEVLVMGNCVVPVLVKSSQKLLQTFLDTVHLQFIIACQSWR